MNSGYLVCSFDMLNVRDLNVIEQARALCDVLVVGVLSDEDVEHLQGRPPVVPLEERATLVGHVRGVSDVVRHDADEVARRAAGSTFFVVAGDGVDLDHALTLTPARESASHTLREALSAQPRSSVA